MLVDGALPGERLSVAVEDRRDASTGSARSRCSTPSPGGSSHRARSSPRAVGAATGNTPPRPLQSDDAPGDRRRRAPPTRTARPHPVVRAGPPRVGRAVPEHPAPGGSRTVASASAAGEHDVVAVDDCLVAVPRLAELLAPGVIEPGSGHRGDPSRRRRHRRAAAPGRAHRRGGGGARGRRRDRRRRAGRPGAVGGSSPRWRATACGCRRRPSSRPGAPAPRRWWRSSGPGGRGARTGPSSTCTAESGLFAVTVAGDRPDRRGRTLGVRGG